MKKHTLRLALLALSITVTNHAQAQMAVIDVQSLSQLQQQVSYWQQQINAMTSQIGTLRQQLSSITGTRGMGALLALTNAQRNYLPASAAGIIAAVVNAPSAPSQLHTAYAQSVASQSALPPAVTAALSAGDIAAISARRSAVATRSSVMQAAMSTASARFAELQALIDQIDRTSDSKGSADLQGRIAAEQAMATNETAKLAAAAAWTDANIASAQTRATEAALAAHGLFATRFHPAAP